uniref:SMC hinge domain-containing protein n=1 Tax=Peronospora matthiolae TaxID=2874970 RepID=A0AAV1TB16_9STRA
MSYCERALEKKLSDKEAALQSLMAYGARRSPQTVRELQFRVRGNYEPLIDLVKPVEERYRIAVDEDSGGALFHVVIDTDDTAARIMKELDD